MGSEMRGTEVGLPVMDEGRRPRPNPIPVMDEGRRPRPNPIPVMDEGRRPRPNPIAQKQKSPDPFGSRLLYFYTDMIISLSEA
jgi:hypothetical protein